MQKISPCLWFDDNAEDAVKFYASIFKNSKVGNVTRYGKEGYEIHKKKEGSVMTIDFEIEGQNFLALNGGPISSLMRLSHFRSIAIRKKKLIITGENLLRVAIRMRRYVDG
jgi:predicted 3-demethylubiquinone-9 3-methyltransferase (glyoxalase superfamily)